MVYTIPFTGGSKTTDLLTTGETTYIPQYPFGENKDFSTGVAAGYFLQKTVFGMLPFASMAFVEWRIQAMLFKRVWPAFLLYESARYTQQAFTDVGHTIGAGPYWAATGDVGSGGAMPIVKADFYSDDPYGFAPYVEVAENVWNLLNPFD